MHRILIALVPLAVTMTANDWPQWRGAQRDGKSTETGLLQKWPTGGPPLAWKVEGLGEGYSTVAISKGRLYTLGQRADTEYVIALDAETGKKVWETAAGSSYNERRGNGPRGVPTVEGDRLWAITADGKLVCLDAKGGELVWKVDFVKQFGGSIPHWGYSESPLIDGNKVIATPGGGGHSVVALDKTSGKLIWKSQSDGAAYSSVSVATVGSVRLYIAFTESGAVGLRADNGELLWTYGKVANQTANVATPIVSGSQVFLSSDYGTGCALLNLEQAGNGVKATEVYFSREMKNHHATSILLNGYLYGFNSSILTAMKWDNGEVAWRDRSTGKGSLVYADNHLIVFGENGEVALVKPGSGSYMEVSRFSLPLTAGRPGWTHPVVANGRLFLRDQNTLYSYRLQP
jgi:outer membrane protein assembly factor BamB